MPHFLLCLFSITLKTICSENMVLAYLLGAEGHHSYSGSEILCCISLALCFQFLRCGHGCVCVCRLKEIGLYVLRFEVFVTVECIEVILSDHLCQCGMYGDVILLQSHIAVHSEHIVWWRAAYIARASLPIFCLVCCIAVIGRFLLAICHGKWSSNMSDVRSSCMLKFSWVKFRCCVLNTDCFRFDHYYCALDALMCLAGTNGVGSTLLNKKVIIPYLFYPKKHSCMIHRTVIKNSLTIYIMYQCEFMVSEKK